MVDTLNNVLYKYNITTVERIRHFLAQCMKESENGLYLYESEYLFIGWKNDSKIKENYKKYFNNRKYPYKYRGVGYIQTTFDYHYKSFATYMISKNYLQYNIKYTTTTVSEIIDKYYNEAINTAKNNNLDISNYIKIYEEGADYVGENYAWEITGWWWCIHNVNNIVDNLKPNNPKEVDKVSVIVNRNDKGTFEERRQKYITISKTIK